MACEMKYPYMGSPKPTYYPIYTQQNGTEGQMISSAGKLVTYKTFLDDDAKLRGWKRYPVREKETDYFEVDDNQYQNTSPFKPLSANTEFECTVRYHNLKEEELGALIYAINVNDNCLHSLGFCKPYGYGVVKIEIINLKEEEIKRLKEVFIKLMSENIDNYKSSQQIRELKEMMSFSMQGLKVPLDYIQSPKDFAKLKNQNERKKEYGYYQQPYSQLKISKKQSPNTHSELKAVVTFASGSLIKAKLTEGKDLQSKVVKMNGIRDRLKIGDRILVKPIKEGKENKLLFLRKI